MSEILENFDHNLNVVVIGASGGIGAGFIDNFLSSDKVKTLQAFARSDISASDDKLTKGKLDLTDEASIETAAKMASADTPIDIVIVATGVLHNDHLSPEKSLRDIDADNFAEIFAINTTGPALVMKHFLPKLNRERKSVFAAVSGRVGCIGDNYLGGWYAYRASKSALHMLIRNASIEVARRNKLASVISLHPGTVESGLSAPFAGNVPEGKLFTPEYSTTGMLNVVDKATADDTGKVFAYDGVELPY